MPLHHCQARDPSRREDGSVSHRQDAFRADGGRRFDHQVMRPTKEFAELSTGRLALRPPSRSDVPELFELYADPRVWRTDPLTRHSSASQTERMVAKWLAGWERDRLGMWIARSSLPSIEGTLVGIGGCFLRHGIAWNLGFRLVPRFWGQGYAQEISKAAVAAARHSRPDLPITAYLLEGNERSERATERSGLRLIWRGPDAGNPDGHAVRLLYADCELSDDVIQVLARE